MITDEYTNPVGCKTAYSIFRKLICLHVSDLFLSIQVFVEIIVCLQLVMLDPEPHESAFDLSRYMYIANNMRRGKNYLLTYKYSIRPYRQSSYGYRAIQQPVGR